MEPGVTSHSTSDQRRPRGACGPGHSRTTTLARNRDGVRLSTAHAGDAAPSAQICLRRATARRPPSVAPVRGLTLLCRSAPAPVRLEESRLPCGPGAGHSNRPWPDRSGRVCNRPDGRLPPRTEDGPYGGVRSRNCAKSPNPVMVGSFVLIGTPFGGVPRLGGKRGVFQRISITSELRWLTALSLRSPGLRARASRRAGWSQGNKFGEVGQRVTQMVGRERGEPDALAEEVRDRRPAIGEGDLGLGRPSWR